MQEFWQEDDQRAAYRAPDDVQELSFRIDCPVLPVDHAQLLHDALLAALPWLNSEPVAGIHLIHGAESGNGWQRPEADGHAILHLSRRARMTLRLPRERLSDAMALSGRQLHLDDYPLRVGAATPRPLSDITTLFARYVEDHGQSGETGFLRWARDAIHELGIRPRKMLAGRTRRLGLAGGDLTTRSLMLAGLEVRDSIRLQQQGLGGGRLFGCGLFVPHKSIEPVGGARAER